MKTLLFHGTTWDAYQNILINGFQKQKPTWNCSEDGKTYFYEYKRVKKSAEYFPESLTRSEVIDRCVRAALDNAITRAAFANSFDKRLVVLCYNVDSIFLEDDFSCSGMCTAVCIPNDIINMYKPCKVYISSAYLPSLRLCYIPVGNDLFNLNTDISNIEIEVAKALRREISFEDLYNFEYEEV